MLIFLGIVFYGGVIFALGLGYTYLKETKKEKIKNKKRRSTRRSTLIKEENEDH